jgi:hypothetical protein
MNNTTPRIARQHRPYAQHMSSPQAPSQPNDAPNQNNDFDLHDGLVGMDAANSEPGQHAAGVKFVEAQQKLRECLFQNFSEVPEEELQQHDYKCTNTGPNTKHAKIPAQWDVFF